MEQYLNEAWAIALDKDVDVDQRINQVMDVEIHYLIENGYSNRTEAFFAFAPIRYELSLEKLDRMRGRI